MIILKALKIKINFVAIYKQAFYQNLTLVIKLMRIFKSCWAVLQAWRN